MKSLTEPSTNEPPTGPLGRRAGTDAERRHAGELAGRLEQIGLRTEPIATYVHPNWAAVILLHCLLLIAASLGSTVLPEAAFPVALVAAVSLYLDLTGRFYLLRRLFFRRASQSVIAPAPGDGPTVIVCAGLDAPHTGGVHDEWAVRAWARFQQIWPARTSPLALVFWSAALLIPPLGLRLAGIDSDLIAILQLPQTVVLVVAAFALGDIALSPTSPGANSASGAEALAAVAQRLEADPPTTIQPCFLLIGGAQPGGQGMRETLRQLGDDLDPDQTWVIELSEVGRGRLRYTPRQFPALAQPLSPDLIELCELLSEDGERCAPLDPAPATLSAVASARGIAAITLTARLGSELSAPGHGTPADLPDSIEPGTIAASANLAADLIALLDRQAGRETEAA